MGQWLLCGIAVYQGLLIKKIYLDILKASYILLTNSWGYSKDLLNSFNNNSPSVSQFFQIHSSLKVNIFPQEACFQFSF